MESLAKGIQRNTLSPLLTNFVPSLLVTNLKPASTVKVFLDETSRGTLLPHFIHNLGNNFRLLVLGACLKVDRRVLLNELTKPFVSG